MDRNNIRPQLEDHHPKLRGLVARLGVEYGLVDDVTQEACVRIIEKEHLWREPGKARGWMNAVARNLTRRRMDQRSREVKRQRSLEREPATPSQEPHFSERQIEWVLEQFASLPVRQQQVLKLRYFEGLTNQQIAAKLEIKEPTVSTHHRRAIDTLRARAYRAKSIGALLLSWLAFHPGKATAAVLLVAGFAVSSSYFFRPDPTTAVVANTETLKRTTVVGHPGLPLDPDKNTVYCASFEMAWQALSRDVVKDSPTFADEPPLVTLLNDKKNSITPADLPEGSLVHGAGFHRDGVVKTLQSQLTEVFGRGPDPQLAALESTLDPTDLVAYAFLARDLRFAHPFYPMGQKDSPALFQGEPDRPIAAWGIPKEAEQRMGKGPLQKAIAQVTTYGNDHLVGKSDYGVRLKLSQDKGEEDELFLVKISPGKTLLETIDKATRFLSAHEGRPFAASERLSIPRLDFDLSHDFVELTKGNFNNAGFTEYRLRSARQSIRFKLDHEGAILRSRALLVGSLAADRHFQFLKPHLVMLRKKGSTRPYLAVWIANGELLLPQ